MASQLLRRSGIAVGLIAEVVGWRADVIYQVGIGHYHKEVEVLNEEWKGVKWFGYEPHPHIFREVKRSYPGTLLPYAIADRDGCVLFYDKPHHSDGSSLFKPADPSPKSWKVVVRRLDTLWPHPKENGERVLLWLDCEGSELMVLNGAEWFLSETQMVNVEITTKPLDSRWAKPEEVHRCLVDHGFRRQWIHTQRISLGQYDATYVRPELFRAEYSCDPFGE